MTEKNKLTPELLRYLEHHKGTVCDLGEPLDVIIKRELNTDRWSEGIEHHPKSLELMAFLEIIDFVAYKDYFCWKTGGDGDNGESLMYQMDAFFECRDRKEEATKVQTVDESKVSTLRIINLLDLEISSSHLKELLRYNFGQAKSFSIRDLEYLVEREVKKKLEMTHDHLEALKELDNLIICLKTTNIDVIKNY